jgi:uncharacterized protein
MQRSCPGLAPRTQRIGCGCARLGRQLASSEQPVFVRDRSVLGDEPRIVKVSPTCPRHRRRRQRLRKRWQWRLVALELTERAVPGVHAGDIGSLQVLDDLETIAPVLAIRGNIDPPARELPETMSIALSDGSKTLLTLLLIHIGVYGVKLRADASRLARKEGASLVVCGHSHVPFIGRDAGLSVFNPGSIGPRRFQLPIVFGVIELRAARVHMRHVSCETGETWSP